MAPGVQMWLTADGGQPLQRTSEPQSRCQDLIHAPTGTSPALIDSDDTRHWLAGGYYGNGTPAKATVTTHDTIGNTIPRTENRGLAARRPTSPPPPALTSTDRPVGAVPRPEPVGPSAFEELLLVEFDSDSDFAEFAAARWGRLSRIAYLLTADFHEAEDLVQTTLIKVCAHWRRIPGAEVEVYVRRALVNNHRSRLRKKRIA